jgi:nitrate ABC transporter ATP-binding subunit
MGGYVELFNLTKAYPNPHGDPVRVVEQFNLNVQRGEVIALLGHSGCGKSTVLTMIAGLNDITDGSVILAGKEIDGPGPDRGVVFQSPCLLPWMTAFDNVMLGINRVYPHAQKRQREQVAEYFLRLVGLGAAMHKRPGELSRGMQQRVGLARAFALQPQMLLLDEPFGMLDSLTRMELQEVLLGMLDQNRITALMVTHDVDEALFVADRIVMMTNGPQAKVGMVIGTPFDRPRDRTAVLEHPEYYELRASMIGFLEEQEKLKHAPAEQADVEAHVAAEADEEPLSRQATPMESCVNEPRP